MALDYVKFQRGTPGDYQILKNRALVEANTLYFIYEAGATSGSLYLGTILIGTVGQSSSVSSLSDLSDVLITNVGATDILVYSSDGKWKNSSIQEIANLIAAEQGLGFVIDENTFTLNPVDGIKTLKLIGFEGAAAGMSPVKGADGKLGWSQNSIDIVAKNVGDLQSELTTLKEDFLAANHLQYKVVENLQAVTENNIVYLVPKTDTGENNGYDEFMLVNNSPEKLGDWSVDLSGYATTSQLQAVSNSLNTLSDNLNNNFVTKIQFNNTVGDLTKLLTYEEGKTISIVDELNNIYEHLVWTSITID